MWLGLLFFGEGEAASSERLLHFIECLCAETAEVTEGCRRALHELLNGADTGVDERVQGAWRKVEDFDWGVALLHGLTISLWSDLARACEISHVLFLNCLLIHAEEIEVLGENLGSETDCFVCGERTVCDDFDDKLLEVGALTDAARFNFKANALDWAEDRIDVNETWLVVLLVPLGSRLVTNSFLDRKIHLDGRTLLKLEKRKIRVEDLNVRACLDITSSEDFWTLALKRSDFRIFVVLAELHLLHVESDVENRLANSFDRRVLVVCARDANGANSCTRQAAEQNATKRVAKRHTVTRRQRTDGKDSVGGVPFFHLNMRDLWKANLFLNDVHKGRMKLNKGSEILYGNLARVETDHFAHVDAHFEVLLLRWESLYFKTNRDRVRLDPIWSDILLVRRDDRTKDWGRFAVLADLDDVANLDTVRRDGDADTVNGEESVRDELARLETRGGKTSAVERAIKPALKERVHHGVGLTKCAACFCVHGTELLIMDTVHGAHLLFLKKLLSVFGDFTLATTACSCLHSWRGRLFLQNFVVLR